MRAELLRTAVMAVLLSGAVTAQAADEQAKAELIKKVYKAEKYSDYASPEFKKIIKQGTCAAEKADPEMGCEMYEHYALGLGNGDADIRNLKITPLQGNRVRATFRNGGDRVTKDFDISCTQGKCVINDVGGVRATYQKIIRTRSCG